jgi:hypothetical protein
VLLEPASHGQGQHHVADGIGARDEEGLAHAAGAF